LAQLEAAAPAKRNKSKRFVVLGLEKTAKAFTGMNCPRATVWLWLVHKARMTGANTVAVPNAALERLGVSRKVKGTALRQLEAAGMVTINDHGKKTPIVTLL
jgi:hypothetical protein